MKAKLKKFWEVFKSYWALVGTYIVGFATIVLGYIGILKLAGWVVEKLFKTDTFIALSQGDRQCRFTIDKEIPSVELMNIIEKLNNNETNFTEVINKLVEQGYNIKNLGVYNVIKKD